MKEIILYFQFNLNVFREIWGGFFIFLFALSIDLTKPDKNKTTKNKNTHKELPKGNVTCLISYLIIHLSNSQSSTSVFMQYITVSNESS